MSIRDERVFDCTSQGGVVEEPTQDVSNDDERIGGEWVALPKTVSTVDPSPRDAIKQNSRLAYVKKLVNPFAPSLRETAAPENMTKTVPVNTVEGLMKVKLKNDGG